MNDSQKLTIAIMKKDKSNVAAIVKISSVSGKFMSLWGHAHHNWLTKVAPFGNLQCPYE